MAITIDGDNLLVTLETGIRSVDVQADIYSESKRWVKVTDNAKYPDMFETEGGVTTVIGEVSGRNFFFKNDEGWRIRPSEEDQETVLVGNLFKNDSTLPMFIPTVGAFTALITFQRSSLALVENGNIADQIVEGSITAQHVFRLILSTLGGKVSGVTTTTESFRDPADSKDRVVVTLDANNNRTSVVLDLTD